MVRFMSLKLARSNSMNQYDDQTQPDGGDWTEDEYFEAVKQCACDVLDDEFIDMPKGWACANLAQLMVLTEDEQMTAKRFRVLFAMTRMADSYANELHCSAKRIAEIAGVGRATVVNAVLFFEKKGVMKKTSAPRTSLRITIDPTFICKAFLKKSRN